ncbi:MAG: hypothetical protein GF364_06240 [Candidatus Lokiarchaeota archaeon]|nr:hypothetical protein [Candidatus Lokiarchaeota archaeon]
MKILIFIFGVIIKFTAMRDNPEKIHSWVEMIDTPFLAQNVPCEWFYKARGGPEHIPLLTRKLCVLSSKGFGEDVQNAMQRMIQNPDEPEAEFSTTLESKTFVENAHLQSIRFSVNLMPAQGITITNIKRKVKSIEQYLDEYVEKERVCPHSILLLGTNGSASGNSQDHIRRINEWRKESANKIQREIKKAFNAYGEQFNKIILYQDK